MISNLFNVHDKVVVITGGLGQLGRQFTAALSVAGARVAIFDVRYGQQNYDEIFAGQNFNLENILVVNADVTSRRSLEAALGEVNAKWGAPHALINNAALDSPPHAPAEENGPFERYPETSWDKVMQVNVKGVFLASQVVGGQMADAGRGSVINISSIYGMVSPDQRIYEYRRSRQAGMEFFKPAAYAVSKSAMLNLTRYLATYWAGKNVRVNTLTLAGVFNHQDDEFLRGYCARVPVGRMAREDEYNGAMIFLISEASSYMTGSNLVIDGGWTAW
jgi:NAD(P)-dependent dehydrogenase (short-subunit alcohol dehydrogenase family)